MSAPVKLDRYPGWMLELASRFQPPTSSKREVVRLVDNREALRYRAQFVGLQNAIEREAREMYPEFLAVRFLVRGDELHLLHC